jgi:riboflavin kinase
MITPDIWFTIYVLANKGAIHSRKVLTTRELGGALGISQQTASRRIAQCVEGGYLSRMHTAEGMLLQVTEKGKNELLRVAANLEAAFAPVEDIIVIEGRLVTGLGEGAYYVDVYSNRLREALGFKPYMGTLNVKVTDEESRRAVGRMKNSPPLVVRGFRHKGRTFGDVICYRVRINDKIEAAIVMAQRTHHSEDILEVIAPFNIRKALNINDDDSVALTVIPLHMAT